MAGAIFFPNSSDQWQSEETDVIKQSRIQWLQKKCYLLFYFGITAVYLFLIDRRCLMKVWVLICVRLLLEVMQISWVHLPYEIWEPDSNATFFPVMSFWGQIFPLQCLLVCGTCIKEHENTNIFSFCQIKFYEDLSLRLEDE